MRIKNLLSWVGISIAIMLEILISSRKSPLAQSTPAPIVDRDNKAIYRYDTPPEDKTPWLRRICSKYGDLSSSEVTITFEGYSVESKRSIPSGEQFHQGGKSCSLQQYRRYTDAIKGSTLFPPNI